MYENLEFPLIKKAVSENCSFSLGAEVILNEEVHFDYLWCERELTRGKEALKLYVAYRSPSFAGVRDLSSCFMDIDKGRVASEMQLYQIAEFSRAGISMKKYMQESSLDTPSIYDLTDSLSIHKKIIESIENAISASYEVKSSASSELKNIRRAISQCESDITKETASFMSRYSDSLMDTITVSRNARTCVLVKNSDKNKIRGFIHGESASGQAVYIEPEVLLQLNNKLQSLKAKESEEIYRILKELTNLVKKEIHAYMSDLDTFALLDALFAKARWAFEREGMYATLTTNQDELYFKNARHPLIDAKKVVSNTYRIAPPYRHLLITGSNTGGKTVTLKTIGLFTILTLSGFPLLCDEAIVPCFEGVYVDIGDAQSIVESLSTFSAHISKLASIIHYANDHSLVLLDELGSGTDPNEGESIAVATLDYFREHHIMTIATTHYSRLKEYAKNKEDILIASVAFDMEKLCPTYKFMEGYSGSSNALAIASRYHLKEEILAHAAKIIEENKSESEVLMEKLDAERMALYEEKEKLSERLLQLEEKEQSFEKERIQFERQKETMLEEAQLKADEIMEEAMMEAEEVITSLKAMKNSAIIKEHEIIAAKSRLNKKEIKEEEVEKDYTFKEKDYVRLKKLNYHGEILTIKGNRATVLANGMKMNVKTSDLEPMKKPVQKKEEKTHISRFAGRKVIKSECNVIGLRVDEAIATIDKYLDSALYNRVYDVRLIHGHGTGALRTAIHKYLRQCKHVESFRLGGEGEGGMGATVVALKRGEK